MENQHVIDGLKVRLAEIMALQRTTEQKLKKLSADRHIITAALRLFDQDGTEMPALGIPRGSFTRTVLECLRDAERPLSVREIAGKLAGEKALDKRQVDLLVARVRNTVPRLAEQLEGELRDRTTFWRVKVDQRAV